MNISILKGSRPKLKTVFFRRVARVLLWTLIIFLLLRGIGTLFASSETGEAQRLINQYVSERAYQERVEFEASAFAEGFAMEYFTYEKGGDYEERLKNYIPSSLSLSNSGYGKTKALSARSYGFEWFSSNQLDVLVAVKVGYELEVEDQGEIKFQQLEKEVFVAIPVMEQEGKYIVEDYPAMLPPPLKADIDRSFYSGTGADTDVVDEVEEVLESFFKTYFSGSSGEISYYMYENKRIEGLKSTYSFDRLDNVRVFTTELENEYLVLAELSIIDSLSKISHKQGYHVELIKSDNRYYIKEFKVRTVNIQN